MITIELNEDDRKLLIAGLRSVPITGTLETLPKALDRIAELMQKLMSVPEEENHDDSTG